MTLEAFTVQEDPEPTKAMSCRHCKRKRDQDYASKGKMWIDCPAGLCLRRLINMLLSDAWTFHRFSFQFGSNTAQDRVHQLVFHSKTRGRVEFGRTSWVHGTHVLRPSEKVNNVDESDTSECNSTARFRHETELIRHSLTTKKPVRLEAAGSG